MTLVLAQQPGHLEQEAAPALRLNECDETGCQTLRLDAVLDANWRWLHAVDGYQSCFTGSSWDASICADADACASKCALEAVSTQKYATTYGVRALDDPRWDVELAYVTGGNVGSRLYAASKDSYHPFRLLGKEIAFDVDLSSLPCGLNAAVYLVAADLSGALGGGNAAGFRYGTGYADAQCPKDLKFVRGRANLDFQASSCATEIDLFEANSRATSFTLHPCLDQQCDRSGAGINPYREGLRDLYGPGLKVDSSRPFRVLTSFRADGDRLVEVSQRFESGGVVTEPLRVTSETIEAQASRFREKSEFDGAGGWASLTKALRDGMVLVLSIWDDAATGMRWLDSTFPPGASGEGATRGPCDGENPADLRSRAAAARVSFGNFTVARAVCPDGREVTHPRVHDVL